MKLTLCGLHKDPYSETCACAYIYYGTAEDPRDQDNNKIDNFMPDAQRDALKKHLEDSVLPQFKNFSTQYEMKEVDYVNNAPHPVIFIARKDKQTLQNHDMTVINEALNRTISTLSDNKEASKKNGARLFSHKHHKHSNHSSTSKQTRYDLRPR